MQPPHPTILHWSSGKDSALALHYLQRQPEFHIGCLLTTVNQAHQRVSMHGLRTELLQQQAAATGIPHELLYLPEQPDHETYTALMSDRMKSLRDTGFTHAAFGDIHLQDLRIYRERQMQEAGLQALFPLWQRDSRELLTEWMDLGFRAVVVCVDLSKLDAGFLGRELDRDFLQDLPAGVDPCGENGEFHTFCYDGPVFRQPVAFRQGETVTRHYNYNGQTSAFGFCDLLPAG